MGLFSCRRMSRKGKRQSLEKKGGATSKIREWLAWSGMWKPAVAAVLATALLRAPAEDLDGSAVVSGGGEVEFGGAASTNWVYNADTDSYGHAHPYGDTDPGEGKVDHR